MLFSTQNEVSNKHFFKCNPAILGYLHKNWMMVGYSFDYTTTRLRNYSSGTHEIVLGLRFSAPKKTEAEN
jgi:hypothetical protein